MKRHTPRRSAQAEALAYPSVRQLLECVRQAWARRRFREWIKLLSGSKKVVLNEEP